MPARLARWCLAHKADSLGRFLRGQERALPEGHEILHGRAEHPNIAVIVREL